MRRDDDTLLFLSSEDPMRVTNILQLTEEAFSQPLPPWSGASPRLLGYAAAFLQPSGMGTTGGSCSTPFGSCARRRHGLSSIGDGRLACASNRQSSALQNRKRIACAQRVFSIPRWHCEYSTNAAYHTPGIPVRVHAFCVSGQFFLLRAPARSVTVGRECRDLHG